ncbi:MAG: hypothetical protein ACK5IN_07190 [Microbacterium sp.]
MPPVDIAGITMDPPGPVSSRGSLHRAAPDAGVRVTVPGEITMYSVGILADPARAPEVVAEQKRLDEIVAPLSVGQFAGFVETPIDTRELFPADTWDRLCAVITTYDPDGLFRAGKPVPFTKDGPT